MWDLVVLQWDILVFFLCFRSQSKPCGHLCIVYRISEYTSWHNVNICTSSVCRNNSDVTHSGSIVMNLIGSLTLFDECSEFAPCLTSHSVHDLPSFNCTRE